MQTDLLREHIGFGGIVITDSMGMGAVASRYSIGRASVAAFNAGTDILLVCHKDANQATVYRALLTAVLSGKIKKERLDDSVRRILLLKSRLHLLSGQSSPRRPPLSVVGSPWHRHVAKMIASGRVP